jgi:hypothetical protein
MCSVCRELLQSAYQVDHTIPLWKGGEDAARNASAMCANCHALKTVDEAGERAAMKRLQRDEHRRRYEDGIRREEENKRTELTRPSGTKLCLDCREVYFPVFAHSCKTVEKRVDTRLGRTRHETKPTLDMLFLNFTFEGGS